MLYPKPAILAPKDSKYAQVLDAQFETLEEPNHTNRQEVMILKMTTISQDGLMVPQTLILDVQHSLKLHDKLRLAVMSRQAKLN